jgi:hypothetical protein
MKGGGGALIDIVLVKVDGSINETKLGRFVNTEREVIIFLRFTELSLDQ